MNISEAARRSDQTQQALLWLEGIRTLQAEQPRWKIAEQLADGSKRFSRNAANWSAPTERWNFPEPMPGSFPFGTLRRRLSASTRNTVRPCPRAKPDYGRRKRHSPHPGQCWNKANGNASKVCGQPAPCGNMTPSS
ncbi:MAG: hypothetical protein ACLSHC_11110, partial [Bilophila wadsworthia]